MKHSTLQRIILTSILFGGALVAADRKAAIDSLVEPAIKEGYLTGVVVAIYEDGKTQVFGYGKARLDSPKVPDGNTVFEIGPVTEAFTGLALSEMIAKKEVDLKDSIRKYLPESQLPAPPEKPDQTSIAPADKHLPESQLPTPPDEPVQSGITLFDLATHSSGLPGMPRSFHPKDEKNPLQDFGVDQLYEALRQFGLFKPEKVYYMSSNLGEGLLGQILALRNHSSYEDMLRATVTKPLGLSDTGIAVTDALRERLAQGYDVDGNPVPPGNANALAGAVGLRSTANDLLKFVAANLHPPEALDAAIHLARAPQIPNGATEPSLTLSWQILADGKTLIQNGRTTGFDAFVAFTPERKTGVVVLANRASMTANRIGMMTFRILAGETAYPLELRHAIPMSAEQLDRYVAKYEMDPNRVYFNVWRDGDHLMGEVTGQHIFRMYPEAEDKFFLKVTDSQITFQRDKDGKITGAMLSQHGHGLSAKRP
jgi:CubicO group peptidase (beta-lactamase class C family)